MPEAPLTQNRAFLPVEGMTCSACAGRVRRALLAVPGVAAAEVNPASGQAEVTGTAAAGDLAAAVTKAGYRVPEDFSVVGMDDLPLSGFSDPPLTTMHIPMRHIGSAALSLLLDDLGVTRLPARRVELACWLVERASTAPAKPGR